MNYIDNNFEQTLNFIKSKGQKGLFEHILSVYKILPIELQSIYKNYFDKFNFWGKIDLEHQNYEYFELKARDIFNNLQKIEWLYKKLSDYTSKQVLLGILNNWVFYSTAELEKCINKKFKHYFDLDLVPKCENEVFVDLGAYTGDTILDFIDCYGVNCYNNIYAYEITPSIFAYLKQNTKNLANVQCKQKAVKDKKGKISLLANANDASSNRTQKGGDIECVTLDDDIKEKITMLKMDIEGDEPSAIIGAKNHIKNDTPTLFVSVYHNNVHLWELPQLIHKISPNYKMYLRYYGGKLYPTEIVLITVPQ